MTVPDPVLPVPDPQAPGSPVGRDFLIRSEEQLHVATERVAAGLARLEKFVVTETTTVTVQFAHEQVRLVHLDAAAATPDEAAGPRHLDPEATDPGRWLTLSREEILVTKKVVPVERVRLEVFTVTEQRQVTEAVRTEQIDTGDLPTDAPLYP